MFRWSVYKPGKMWVYMDSRKNLLGGFVTKVSEETPYKAIVPKSISSKPSRSAGYLPVEGLGGLYYNHKIIGSSDTLEGAKDMVENYVQESTTTKPTSVVSKLF